MNAKLVVGLVAALVWCAAIVGKHFWADMDVSQITLACSNVLTGLGAYHLAGGGQEPGKLIAGTVTQDLQPVAAPGAQQVGRMHVQLLTIIASIAIGVSLLAGCSTAAVAWEAGAAKEVRAANDNALSVYKAGLCAFPVGAVLRDPSSIDTVNKWCGGGPAVLGANPQINVTVQMPAGAASAAK